MELYVLYQEPCYCGCGEPTKIIGVYSSGEKAQEAFEDYAHKIYSYKIEVVTLDE